MSGEVLDYSVTQEVRGAMHEGRLRLSSQNITFRDTKTGKNDTIVFDDLHEVFWRRVASGWQLKFRLTNGKVKKYDGLKEDHLKKLQEYMKNNHDKEIQANELSCKGWNWGKMDIEGDEMAFTLDDGKISFEIPLSNVSNCISNRNELTLEFHQNEEANQITMMECRFHMPPAEENSDPTLEMTEKVLEKADVLQAKGAAITTLNNIQCLTPRGRYDLKIYPSFLHLHGRTFDFKLTYTSIIRLFLLPHKDHRQVFFVISVDPPIKQGQTRYPFVICLFDKDHTQDITLDMTENELKDKYEGRLQKNMTGATFEVVSRLMKAVTGRKITVPGSYKSDQGNNCVSCSYKAQNGVLFPLERGFMYLHKPPIYIRFDEIDNVNFARESSKLRSFEFHIETKQGGTTKQVFGTIDRSEYTKLYDFAIEHALKIRNIKGHSANPEEALGSSSDEETHDFYKNVISHERDQNLADDDDDDSSTDEDFDPDAADPEAKEGGDEEYDSDAADRSTDSEDRNNSSGDEGAPKKEKKPSEKKKRKPSGGDPPAPRRKKEKKERIGPKRSMSAYFFFLADEREAIKKENPDIKVTDVSKVAGQRWKEISAERKAKYDLDAKTDRERYEREKKEFTDGGGVIPSSSKSKSSKPTKQTAKSAAKPTKKQSPVRSPSKSAPKSQEIIEDSDSDSD